MKNIASFCGLRWARKIQNFHIKHTWINGLLQPYADIARAQDKDKPLGALIDKVQDEGAAKIHRRNYKDHASTMRTFQQFGKHSSHRVNTVDEAPEEQKSDDSVAAAMGTSKFCRYCKTKGHNISECRKKPNGKQNKNYMSKKPNQTVGQPKDNPADPCLLYTSPSPRDRG